MRKHITNSIWALSQNKRCSPGTGCQETARRKRKVNPVKFLHPSGSLSMSECLFMFTHAWLWSRYPVRFSFPFDSMEKDLATKIYYDVKGSWQQKLHPAELACTRLRLQQEHPKDDKGRKLIAHSYFTDISNAEGLENFQAFSPLFNLSESIRSISTTNLSSKVHYHSHAHISIRRNLTKMA